MWTRLVTLLLVTLVAVPANAQTTPADASVWATFADALEPGTFLVVKTREGRRMKGTFVQRTTDGIVVQEKTRIPVAPREVRFTDVVAIERAKQGWSPGLKVVTGVGIGVAATLFAALLAFAAYGYD
jgi:hypothetical protein